MASASFLGKNALTFEILPQVVLRLSEANPQIILIPFSHYQNTNFHALFLKIAQIGLVILYWTILCVNPNQNT